MRQTHADAGPVAGTPIASPTRDRILDAAERLFADRGFSGTAMRDIAARVELNPASLYNHFSSKQALYEAVLARGLSPLFEILDSLAHADWTEAGFDEAAEALIAGLARRPEIPRLIVHEALAGGERLTRLAENWLRPLYARALSSLRESGPPGKWGEAELPSLLLAFHHLILGHFAAAPMLRELLDEDPLAPEAIERHRRFVRKVAGLLLGGGAPPGE
jgi:AcrR family transcriptional regulator